MEFQTQMRLAANLRQLRVSSGLSQSELARRLQADRSMLALYESGRRNPDLETVYKLSKMYGLRMETMLECDPVNILGEVTYRKVCEDGKRIWYGHFVSCRSSPRDVCWRKRKTWLPWMRPLAVSRKKGRSRPCGDGSMTGEKAGA